MKNIRKEAKELLHAAAKVFNYRCDVMSPEEVATLETESETLQALLVNKTSSKDVITAQMELLNAHLLKVGGKLHPKTFFSDNIEVLVVAAIVVIAIRTFFFQPFIIPTNSMYPTYSGMREYVYETKEAPTSFNKVLNLLTLGARHRSAVAQASGELSLLYVPTSKKPVPFYEVVDGRKWFGLFPAKFKEFVLFVGDTPHRLRVPAEFSMEGVFDTLMTRGETRQISSPDPRLQRWATGLQFNEGETFLAFDIRLGDALFVDRLTYHFRKPEAGDPFVFRTNQILDAVGKATGDYTPKYYIKRIGGVEGETIEITDHTLLVDGIPRDEVPAFNKNALMEGDYVGYQNERLLAPGKTMEVPEDSYVALGDNSKNSADSRYWGFVPQDSVIGRAIFIYYPFTKRWGVSE